MTDFNALASRFEDLLQQEKATRVESLDAFHQAQARRTELFALQSQLVQGMNKLGRQLGLLPALASVGAVQWAIAALEMNPVFLVVDTTSISPGADIIRLFVREQQDVVYDTIIKPGRQTRQPNTAYTGILQKQLEIAPTLKEAWPKLQEVLRGRYVLAYNLPFIRERLQENATHYRCPDLALIGGCLLERAADYFGEDCSIKLSLACARIGHTLSPYPAAPERALGQLALLRAMAQGITSAQTPAAPEEELDDHPF